MKELDKVTDWKISKYNNNIVKYGDFDILCVAEDSIEAKWIASRLNKLAEIEQEGVFLLKEDTSGTMFSSYDSFEIILDEKDAETFVARARVGFPRGYERIKIV